MAIVKPSSKRQIGHGRHGHNGSLHHYYDNYTIAALVDELVLALSSKCECNLYENDKRQTYLAIFHPYLNKAEGLLYRINIYRPIPEFVINKEDIPQPLAKAIRELGYLTMNRIITEAVRRLYESVDHDYFHINGLYGKVRWTFSE